MSGGAGYVINSKALSKVVNFLVQNSEKDYIQTNEDSTNNGHHIIDGCKTFSNEGIEDLELGKKKINNTYIHINLLFYN